MGDIPAVLYPRHPLYPLLPLHPLPYPLHPPYPLLPPSATPPPPSAPYRGRHAGVSATCPSGQRDCGQYGQSGAGRPATGQWTLALFRRGGGRPGTHQWILALADEMTDNNVAPPNKVSHNTIPNKITISQLELNWRHFSDNIHDGLCTN